MSQENITVQLWSLSMPLVPPLKSAKGTRSTTYALMALADDGEGHCGVGYSSFHHKPDLEKAGPMARALVDAAGPSLAALLNIERMEQASAGSGSFASRAAANALSLAAWDLAGRRAGVPCADLWGRPAHRDAIECYASAFWMDKSPEQLIAEGREHWKNNYRLVKMRVGRSIPDTLERLAAVRTVYREPRTIALETAFEWGVDITNRFLQEVPGECLWIEDPAPYDVIGQIDKSDSSNGGERNVIAAGEKCTEVADLFRLYADGIRHIIIDVQYVGGPVRFLEAARALNALGAKVGAHRFSHYSIHLLTHLPASMPIEMLDWTNPAIHPLPSPDPSGKLPVRGPGFGVSFDQSMVERYGVRL